MDTDILKAANVPVGLHNYCYIAPEGTIFVSLVDTKTGDILETAEEVTARGKRVNMTVPPSSTSS